MLNYRRRLPHIHAVGMPVFITWRLWGTVVRIKRDAVLHSGRAFVAHDRELERAGVGPTWLANSAVAAAVTKTIFYGMKARNYYDLHAWVIMSNHIHLLITPREPLPVITQCLKGSSARQANRILCRPGQRFWLDESYDRLVRNTDEFRKTCRYIEHNPVAAGIVSEPRLYPWSSAGWAG